MSGQADLIDGKAVAAELRQTVAEEARDFTAATGIVPGLTVVLVGEDPASQVYVRSKERQTAEVGFVSNAHRLSADTSQDSLLALIVRLNHDPAVHGILVQLPLPPQIDEAAVLATIDPDKDVDGFHVVNAGRLATGQDSLVPCTPQGCIILARTVVPDLSGMEAVVIGRSNIVGKPLAQLLLRENCTVTVAHSRSRDLPDIARRADLLVAAVGRPEMVRGDWVRPGAVVIDVGVNRIPLADGKNRLVGDVAFEEARQHARAITPVPGGVGPMTIACLLRNTLAAAQRQSAG